MDNIVEWIKKIAVFYILAILALNIIPNEKYRKYIKFFLGIVMIIMIAKPVGELFGFEDKFNSLLNYRYNTEMSSELVAQIKLAGESRNDAILEEYENVIAKDISEYVTGIGAYFIEAETEFDIDEDSKNYGKIKKISVSLSCNEAKNSKAEQEIMTLDIKNHLSGVYYLDKSNIYVKIE